MAKKRIRKSRARTGKHPRTRRRTGKRLRTRKRVRKGLRTGKRERKMSGGACLERICGISMISEQREYNRLKEKVEPFIQKVQECLKDNKFTVLEVYYEADKSDIDTIISRDIDGSASTLDKIIRDYLVSNQLILSDGMTYTDKVYEEGYKKSKDCREKLKKIPNVMKELIRLVLRSTRDVGEKMRVEQVLEHLFPETGGKTVSEQVSKHLFPETE